MFEPCDCNPAVAAGRRLRIALAGSVLLHGLAISGGQALVARFDRRPPPAAPAPLRAMLLPAPAPAPTLIAPEIAPPPRGAVAKPLPKPPGERRARRGAQADLTTLAARQVARALLYPEEAVVRGIEGEALVMLFLDEAGDAITARLERSSGHAILDAAAVAAARRVRALPEGEAREVLLPVRFRLR